MKVMLLFQGTAEGGDTPTPEQMATYQRIGEWWAGHTAAGTIEEGHELRGPETARRVTFEASGPVVTDGPFAEASEVVGGYAIVDVPHIDAAVDLARTWPGGGPVEIRPIRESANM